MSNQGGRDIVKSKQLEGAKYNREKEEIAEEKNRYGRKRKVRLSGN